jgi:hypothetical protein
MLRTQSQETITSNMGNASSLTLGILKSLYPWANLGTEEEAGELVWSFIETATQVIEMIPVDMS